MTRFAAVTAAAMVIGLTPAASTAAPLDGSTPFVCAGTEIRECEVGGECPRRTTNDVNLPGLIRVDAKGKTLAGFGGDTRTAPIHAVEQRDGRLIMYGGQEGRGWTFVVTSATGRMSASVVDDGFSFVIFGTCAEHKP